ncbi:hypothetical protein PDK35_02460 [Bacillus cereus group sp. TH153LC]|uniref:hypothetical protein n=1 Tax=Bacillus cereus group sp. TH153LC TaxID=3018059 RepID=UPI0022E63F0C|nr:hypothetical protein [Bacillus cereus group sp. TH153LC]MDA1658838.1 hypothetical protein [Bacillus cereus group sp. TH153LC]
MSKEIINFEGKNYKKEVLCGGEIKLIPFEHSWGDVFRRHTDGELYMLVQSELRRGNLVGLRSGNRYSDDYAGSKDYVISQVVANNYLEYVGRINTKELPLSI